MQFEELTRKVIGCAYEVYNDMGFGFLESVYEKCMDIELSYAKIVHECQKPLTVSYRNQPVGQFAADIVVDNKVILELKSVTALTQAHEVQLVNYLVATGLDVGLLINFGPEGVDVKRKVRQLGH